MLKDVVFVIDEYGCWNLKFDHEGREVHAFIQIRPPYCDRGHFVFNVDGVPNIDGADSFPRYFMDLDAAMTEAVDWLNWRLFKIPFKPRNDVSITRDFGVHGKERVR